MDDSTYKDLSVDEWDAMIAYTQLNDRHALDAIISEGDMTKDMRRFVAGVVNGSVKRPPGLKPSTDLRNIQIYNRITNLLLDDPSLNLTSSRSVDGAGAIAAKEFGMDDGATIKAFNKVKKEMEDTFYDALHER